MGGIIVEKLKNPVWAIFYYLDTRVPHNKWATFSDFCNIASVFLFIFIIAYPFLYIVLLLLFGCFNFIQRHKVWVQFISVRRILQDIGLLLYIHCSPRSNDQSNFSSLYYYVFNIVFLTLHHFVFLLFLFCM